MNTNFPVTSGTASRALGVSLLTLSKWVHKGLLHPVRAANGWYYYKPDEIIKIAKAGTRKSKTGGRP